MEQSLFVAAIICIVILVGVAVPVLLQLRTTLRAAQVFLDGTGATLKQTLEDVSSAAATLNHAAGRIEEHTEGLERLFQGLGSVAGSLGKLRELFHKNSRPATEADAAAPTVHSGGRRRRGRVDQSEAPRAGTHA